MRLERSDRNDQNGRMSRVSVSEIKAELSRYLREVRRGGEVEILDRGVPVARLVAAAPGGGIEGERRARLIRAAVLRQGAGGMSTVLDEDPLEVPTSVLEALEAERADRV